MNKSRQPFDDCGELRVVEKEIESDRQWDHPEKQLSHGRHESYLRLRKSAGKTL
jgi:hypothetical protein